MISRQIADRIRAGDFPEGSRLPSERELAGSMHVSRTSVREALIALEIEGLVEVRVGSGVYVLRQDRRESAGGNAARGKAAARVSGRDDPDRQELREYDRTAPPAADMTPFELVHVHLLLEPESAALAARHASDEQVQAIMQAARGLEDADSPAAHNILFHLAIADASGNAALASTIRDVWRLRDESALYSRLENHFVPRKIWHIAENEHMDIAQAIARHDVVLARRAMRVHFMEIRQRLREDFRSQLFVK
ncbi:FadR/GntR family transcriptional regulator [Allopusillimonas soli]|nr:FadR/GntR family transcriptional regulator [Allopusillimonas soli]